MALVLRKAVTPKNVSLLKCIKGRPLATTANKKTAAPTSKIIPWRNLKDETKMQRYGHVKFEKSQPATSVEGRRRRGRGLLSHFCVSCPNLVPESRLKIYAPPRHLSPPRTKPVFISCTNSDVKSTLRAQPFSFNNPFSGLLKPNVIQVVSKRDYSAASPPCSCGCPCPFPCGPYGCGGCGCLPPPSNTPPRCIQYMTGYYYYPYGWWFCGPYHVSGTCTPVGPCSPSGPCGPCVKCGPACICPAATTAMVSPQGMPKPNSFTGNVINSPLPQEPMKQPRTGISKFFPFNTNPSATSPGQGPLASGQSQRSYPDPKKPMPPFMSAFMCLPFGTEMQSDTPNRYCTPMNQLTSKYSAITGTSPGYPAKPSCNGFSQSNKYCTQAYPQSYYHKEKNRSPIRHKRSKKYICDNMCPSLKQPRVILTREQRDKPKVNPGAFDYASVPNYKSPYPPQPFEDIRFNKMFGL